MIKGHVIAKNNEALKLVVSYQDQKVEIKGDLVEQSKTSPTLENDIRYSLNKLGNTPFQFEQLEIEKDENIFIRVYSLNELRRKMVEKLSQIINTDKPFVKESYHIDLMEQKEEKGFSVFVSTLEDYDAIKNKPLKNIYMNEDLYKQVNDSRKTLKVGRVVSNYPNTSNNVLIGELGGVWKYQTGMTDFSLNIVNSYSIAFLNSLGIKRITLSYELNDFQMKEMIENYKRRYNQKPNLELIVSSKPEVMISKFNLLRYFDVKGKNNYLKDNYNNLFPVEEENNKMIIKFYKKIKLQDYQKYFDMGINTLRIHVEDKEDYNF